MSIKQTLDQIINAELNRLLVDTKNPNHNPNHDHGLSIGQDSHDTHDHNILEYDIPEYVSRKNRNNKNKKVLILSGGGIKGVIHIGCLRALDELDILSNTWCLVAMSHMSIDPGQN